uniref:Ribosomal RNA-processing protein 40 n=1 Tax=Guillardia theta (strain CCMP2712) TaxID=905079 RepID=A0A0C3T5I7_GUITC
MHAFQFGCGISQDGENLVAIRAGQLRTSKTGIEMRMWIDSNTKRYVPVDEDLVIGIVVDKRTEDYRLDVRGPSYGVLSALSFEGATKRNKPKLEIGSLVYCRVSNSYRDAESELSCLSLTYKKAVFGELEGGHMIETSIGYARSLLLPENVVVNCLGRHLAYEIAVGCNGRVIWIKSDSVAKTILIANAIRNAEYDELICADPC